MRRAVCGLVMVVTAAVASASPPNASPPKKIAPADQSELTKLQTELTQAQVKQRYGEAAKIARKLYARTLELYGADAWQTRNHKQALASALTSSADYGEARKVYLELIADAEQQNGPESKEVLMLLTQLAANYTLQKRLDDAEPVYQRKLDIAKKLYGENSREYANELGYYGGYLISRNEYASSLRAYEAQHQILASILPPNDMQLMGTCLAIAGMYWIDHDQRAIQYFDRAIQIAETAPNTSPRIVGSIINSAAMQYHYAGRDDLAAPLVKRVLAVYEPEIQRLEATHSDLSTLGSLLMQDASVHEQMHDVAAAEELYQRAVAVEKQALGYSSSAVMLAELYRRTGKFKEAIALLEETNEQMAAKFPKFAHTYDMSIANVLRDMGDFSRAETLLSAYLGRLEKTSGKHDAIYGNAEIVLAYVYMGAHDIPRAVRTLNDALELSEVELKDVLKLGTEQDHAHYFSRNAYKLEAALNLNYAYAPKDTGATRLAVTTIFRRKGRALDAAAGTIAAIRQKLSPADKQLLDDLAEARAKLAQLTVTAKARAGDPQYAKEVAALEDRILKLELDIDKKSALYHTVNQAIDLPSVQRAIPRTARLVEIVSFQPMSPNLIDPAAASPPRRYAAYVVARTGDPVFIDLGEEQPINDAVERFRKAVSDPDNDRANELGRALYDLTMAKIAPVLHGATDVLMAPDGPLNVVPFSALVDENDHFLIQRFTFTYLTSGRDLLRIHAGASAHGGGVIFADPAFDVGGKPAGDGVGGARGVRAAELSQLVWPPLPGTGQEAAAVAKTMHGFTLHLATDATEAAVKAVHAPKILHIATHGFFLPDPPAPPPSSSPTDTTAMVTAAPASPATVAYQNPLLRSGLVFAGANKLSSPSGDGDGLLTALEASGLDLEGTELVVLSACETGVGKVTNGDGVYGLRRALVIAGAQTLVMSLWQVDDQATKDLMVGYYARLARGMSRSAALRDVQLELARGAYKHPYYWASFLPAGNDSPL
jgi:CHAT domain-containing protein